MQVARKSCILQSEVYDLDFKASMKLFVIIIAVTLFSAFAGISLELAL